MIPGISPTSPFGTILPLIAILIFTLVKEIIEDSKRHATDYRVNNSQTLVLQEMKFVKKAWKDVQVGDLVKVVNRENFPADMILISSSESEAQCYIETSNLDGETNLKNRQGLPETKDIREESQLSMLKGKVQSEQPNSSLYTFDATLIINGQVYPLCPDQLLLRGAQLRNTDWIVGLVCFTGHETKLVKNSITAPIKKTKVELMVNSQIIFLFLILFLMAVTCSAGSLYYGLNSSFTREILLNALSPNQPVEIAWFWFKNTLTFIVLFNNLIPLSLMVTLEIVKVTLSVLIEFDLDIYHGESDTRAAVRTSSLVEELGQVDYIFSDKTGTLTCNIMEFKMASIGSKAYAEKIPECESTVRRS